MTKQNFIMRMTNSLKNSRTRLSKITIALAAIALVSCSEGDSTEPKPTELASEFGEFTKELTIYDAEKANSAVLLVGSNDASILRMWSSDNFELVAIREGQTFQEAMEIRYPIDEALEEEDALDTEEVEDGDEDVVASEITAMIVSKQLQAGIRSVALTTTMPVEVEDLRGHKKATFPSTAEEGQSVKMIAKGYNLLHKGYWALDFKKTAAHSWGTIQGKWKRIKKGKTHTRTRNPCYQMRAKTRFGSGSVTIAFEEN